MTSLARRVGAYVALIAFAAVFVIPFTGGSHPLIGDDAACGGEELVARLPGTQFEPVLPSAVPEHCALCHWLRTFSGAQVAVAIAAPIEANLQPAVLAPGRWLVRSRTASNRASRAPPVSLLS
jgi:hypothetical protein